MALDRTVVLPDRTQRRRPGPARRAVVPAVILLAALVRLAYLAGGAADFNGDEAVTGIMVRRILHGETFVFFPGQHYGGTLEVYLQSLGYLVFRLPPNPLTLRLALVALCAATTGLVYLCARRMLPTWRQAVVAAAFYAIGPWYNVVGGVTALGFYVVGAALGAAALYCALRLGAGRRGDAAWMLGFGLCAGLGFWNSLTSLYLIAPAAVWALPYLVREVRAAAAAAVGFVVGAAPALRFIVLAHRLPLPPPAGTVTSLRHRAVNLGDPVLREFVGVAYTRAAGGPPRAIQYLIVLAVAVVYAVCLWRRRRGLLALATLRRQGREPADLLLVAPVFIAPCYVTSSMAWYTESPRYLFSAYPLLALAVAAVLPWRRPGVSLTASGAVLGLSAFACLAYVGPPAGPTVDERDAVLRRVVALLVAQRETEVYAHYSTAMVLQYLGRDRLDVAACDGAPRFAGIQARVRASAHPVFVATPRRGLGPLTDPSDDMPASLSAAHVTFRATRIGFAAIYDRLSGPVPPQVACR